MNLNAHTKVQNIALIDTRPSYSLWRIKTGSVFITIVQLWQHITFFNVSTTTYKSNISYLSFMLNVDTTTYSVYYLYYIPIDFLFYAVYARGFNYYYQYNSTESVIASITSTSSSNSPNCLLFCMALIFWNRVPYKNRIDIYYH